jgi:hypothetical protein
MLPIIVNWNTPETDNLCAAQTFVENVPLVFVNPIPIQDPFSTGSTAFSSQPVVVNGVASYINNLPKIFNNAGTGVPNINLGSTSLSAIVGVNQARQLEFTFNGTTTETLNVTVIGTNQFNEVLTEDIEITNSSISYSVNYYTIIYSITPDQTSSGENVLSVGTSGEGNTAFPMLDIYNKNALYNISYTNITGTIEVSPVFFMGPMMTFVNRQQLFTPISASNWLELPVADIVVTSNTAIVAFPATLTAGDYASFSMNNIPMASLGTFVTSSDGSFTQTIIQQGARF